MCLLNLNLKNVFAKRSSSPPCSSPPCRSVNSSLLPGCGDGGVTVLECAC